MERIEQFLFLRKEEEKIQEEKNGHRQQFSLIRINKIFSKDGKIISEAEKMKKENKKEVKTETKEVAK